MKPNLKLLNLDNVKAVPSCLKSNPDLTTGRLLTEKPSFNRTEFERDRDRIINSGAFRKLQYKAQVFSLNEGTYYRTRLTHTIEVNQIARTIAKCLNLDVPLTECTALSHDLGHTCFGHSGEDALNEVMQKWGGFNHNDQSLRVVTHLEHNYPNFNGLNLTWESLEGLVKHNGPVKNPSQEILNYTKTHDLQLSTFASLEAQVTAISDDIAYNSNDIEDGMRAGFLKIEDLQNLPLIGDIIDYLNTTYGPLTQTQYGHQIKRYVTKFMIQNILETTTRNIEQASLQSIDDVRSHTEQLVAFNDEFKAIDLTLRAALKEQLYENAQIYRLRNRVKRGVKDLFHLFLEDPKCLPQEWYLLTLDQSESQKVRIIADYIAGMTDKYAATEYKKLFGYIENFMI